MQYLITGAQGFTGRYLTAEILRTDPDARIVGTGRSPELSETFTHLIAWKHQHIRAPLVRELRSIDSKRYRYIRCELAAGSSLDALLEQAAPDVVIHLAAALRDDPADVLIASNVAGTIALIAALARLPKKPLVVVGSSGSVYGTPPALPLREDHRCAPHEPYAMSKFAAELAARVLSSGRFPVIWARIFNIAGPGQEERHVCGRFAAQAAAIALGDREPELDVGDLRPTRDFIDVRDVASALIRLAQNGEPGEIYNVASGRETAIKDVLAITLRAANLEGKVSFSERYAREADIPRAYADIEKLKHCGFSARFDLERTIADLLEYYFNEVSEAAAHDTPHPHHRRA